MRCSDTFHSAENCPEGPGPGHKADTMDAPGAVPLADRLRLLGESIKGYADRHELGADDLLRDAAATLGEMAAEGAARWRTGRPPDHGYYLAAWKTQDGRFIVSELWFNPDSASKHSSGFSGWWSTRRYLGDRQSGMDGAMDGVVAWMPVPGYDGPGA